MKTILLITLITALISCNGVQKNQNKSKILAEIPSTADGLSQQIFKEGRTKAYLVLGDPDIVNFGDTFNSYEDVVISFDGRYETDTKRYIDKPLLIKDARKYAAFYNDTEGAMQTYIDEERYNINYNIEASGRTHFLGITKIFKQATNSLQVLITDSKDWNTSERNFPDVRSRDFNNTIPAHFADINNAPFNLITTNDKVGELIKMVQEGIFEELTIKLVEGRNYDAQLVTELLERLKILNEAAPETFPAINVELYLNQGSLSEKAASKFFLAHEDLVKLFPFVEFSVLVSGKDGYEAYELKDPKLNVIKKSLKKEYIESDYYRKALEGSTRPAIIAQYKSKTLDLRFIDGVSNYNLKRAVLIYADGRTVVLEGKKIDSVHSFKERLLNSDYKIQFEMTDGETVIVNGSDIEKQSKADRTINAVPQELKIFINEMEQASLNAQIRAEIAKKIGEMQVNSALPQELVESVAKVDVKVSEAIESYKDSISSDYKIGSKTKVLDRKALAKSLESLKPEFDVFAEEHLKREQKWIERTAERYSDKKIGG